MKNSTSSIEVIQPKNDISTLSRPRKILGIQSIYNDNTNIKTHIVRISSSESEYKILFQDSLKNDKSKFLTQSHIFDFWKISDYIWEQIKNNNIETYG